MIVKATRTVWVPTRMLALDISRIAPLILFEQPAAEHVVFSYRTRDQEDLDGQIAHLRPLTNAILAFLSPLRQGLAATILSAVPFLAYLLIALVVSLMTDRPFSEAFTGAKVLYLPFLFALSMYAFFFIDWCFGMLSSSRFWIISFFLDSYTLNRLQASLSLAFRLALQFAVCTFTTLVVAVGVIRMMAPADALEWWIALWWIWVMGFLVGNGFYWSLLVPQVANFFLFAREVEYDELSPANTPGLRCIASIVGMAAIFDSVVVTSILYVLADPHFPHAAHPATRIFFLVYLAVGASTLLYAFFYPLVSLSRLVIRLKRKTEYALLRMRLDSRLTFRKEQQLRTLLKEVRASPDVPHVVHLISRLFIALVLPVGVLLIQLLVLR